MDWGLDRTTFFYLLAIIILTGLIIGMFHKEIIGIFKRVVKKKYENDDSPKKEEKTESHGPELQDIVRQRESTEEFQRINQKQEQELQELRAEIGSLKEGMRSLEERMKNDRDVEQIERINQEQEELRAEIRSLKEKMRSLEERMKNDRDGEEIEWLRSLRKGLKEGVENSAEGLDEETWRELEARVEYLDQFGSALEEIKNAMSSEDRDSFAVYVEREVEKPLKQIWDLLTLREIQNDSEDPVLLLKGALIGEEVFNLSSITSLLRRTRPAQMIRYFLPEIDNRVTEKGEKGAQLVFDLMMDLGGDEVEIIGARAGDGFDMRRYQIVSQDTSGTQARDRIVRCVAHGLKNSQTDEIELKAKVVIAV